MTRGRQRGRRVIASAYGWRLVMVTPDAPPPAPGWLRVGLSDVGQATAAQLAARVAPAVLTTMGSLMALASALGHGGVPMLEVRAPSADVRRARRDVR